MARQPRPTADGLVPADLDPEIERPIRIFHPPHGEDCPVCRDEMADDEDVGLPAALAAVLLVIGVAAGFLFACWMFAFHMAEKGRLPW